MQLRAFIRTNDDAANVESILERQYHWDVNRDNDFHAPPARFPQSLPAVHRKRDVYASRSGERGLGNQQVAAERLAENWLQRCGVQEQQDGDECDDAGMAPFVEGRWGEGLVCFAGIPGYGAWLGGGG